MEKRITKSEDPPFSFPPNNHFTILTEEGALVLTNLVVSPDPLTCLYYCSFGKIEHYKLNRKWQMTFIQNYYEKKIENENQNISGSGSSPPKAVTK